MCLPQSPQCSPSFYSWITCSGHEECRRQLSASFEAKDVKESAGFVELLETGMEKASCLRYRMYRGKRPLFYASHQLSYVWSNNYMHLKGKEKGTFVNDLFTLTDSRKIFCNKLPNTPPPVVLKCLSESPQNKLEQLTQADLYVYKLVNRQITASRFPLPYAWRATPWLEKKRWEWQRCQITVVLRRHLLEFCQEITLSLKAPTSSPTTSSFFSLTILFFLLFHSLSSTLCFCHLNKDAVSPFLFPMTHKTLSWCLVRYFPGTTHSPALSSTWCRKALSWQTKPPLAFLWSEVELLPSPHAFSPTPLERVNANSSCK